MENFLNKQTFITKSADETIELAMDIAKNAKSGTVFCLNGEMAAGKTHFAKGFAKGLGIKEDITSPTFNIHNMYEYERGVLNHFDFYRIDEEAAIDLDLDEYFGKEGHICLIEWGENIKSLIPSNAIEIKIDKIGESERKIGVKKYNFSHT
ncbi:MAG: tRNA (adenosine(37)-N6)-threonylcarbamoyltransferase complex ATPase subunit type 1 TsaE [Defluviitaleaceae bacterium]|nr:tRNA (adenosine(37)-N6)-threonylcarbamoyltransferase complex ATPase subunit type 1 TsaE [Defluviitaleaceae bacterium]